MRHWKIILTLVAIFVAGTITGAVITVRVVSTVANNRLNPERWPTAMLHTYRTKLKLSPEQIEQIRPAIEEGRQELRRVMGTAVRDYVGIMQRLDEQLSPVLNDEQRKLHEQMREEIRAKLRQRLGNRPPES